MKLLRPKDCASALGVSTATLWRLAKTDGFPTGFRVSRQAIAWDEAEVLAWLATRRVECVRHAIVITCSTPS